MRTRPQPPALGVPVTERQAPELWSLVRELAALVDTRPPDEIRAVLARELGHYSHQHTPFAVVVYWGGVAMMNTIIQAGPRNPAPESGRIGVTEPPLDPGQEPDSELLLPDQLFFLVEGSANSAVLEAALAASTLAELRLRERIELAPAKEGTVLVRDPTGTGDGLLDSVLTRLSESPRLPAYRWVHALGRDVARTMLHRIRQRREPPDLREQARAGIARRAVRLPASGNGAGLSAEVSP